MSRRAKAIGFGILAAFCAIASASIAAGYRDSVESQLGELRTVVVVAETLAPGRPLSRRALDGALELREVPVRFAPPDALIDPSEALGRKPLAPIPAGSYLLSSQLRTPTPGGGQPEDPALGGGLSPVEITVTGAGALAATAGTPGTRVDVVVAGEPVTGARARVRVVASGVRLIALEPATPEQAAAGADSWRATLALRRDQALDLIEAENFAREVRLIPAG